MLARKLITNHAAAYDFLAIQHNIVRLRHPPLSDTGATRYNADVLISFALDLRNVWPDLVLRRLCVISLL
eukprot:6571486-Pyramimonas_sp.AAC.1